MSLRLEDFRQHDYSECDEEDLGQQYDPEELTVREPDETSLECIVYFDPNHPIGKDLEQLEADLLAEIAPYYRAIDFRPLSRSSFRLYAPLPTRDAEINLLKNGFVRGPGPWPIIEPKPRRKAGNTAHLHFRQESQAAFHVLALMTEMVLDSVKELMPGLPDWLDSDTFIILVPVCGKISKSAGDEVSTPGIPLILSNGLLFGCTNFEARRTVFPSHICTPDASMRAGRGALKSWREEGRCDLSVGTVRSQIKRELSNPVRHFGVDFDLAGAALWMCQCVMQMRLSVDDVRRRTAASWFASENEQETHAIEDQRLLDRLYEEYGNESSETRIAHDPPTFTRRALEVYYGVAFDTWDYCDLNNPEHRAFMEFLSFVRWIRQLRLTGSATLNLDLALDIRDLIEQDDPYFMMLFTGDDRRKMYGLLADLLPKAGRQALCDAARIVRDKGTEFNVTYSWEGLSERGPSGHVDEEKRHVEIIGPLLMLPLHAADYWKKKARTIPADGLYA